MDFKHIHGPVEMMQAQSVRALNADILSQPLFITVELGTGGTRSVGHHGKEGAFDWEIEFAAAELVRKDVGEAQALPERFQDIQSAIGPGIDHTPLVGVLHNLFGSTLFEDASGEVSQALGRFGVLRAAAIIENANLGALFLGIPHALGQLEVRDQGAIGSFLTGFTQVHVRKDKEIDAMMSSQVC
jgi:hypothetical protein